VLSGQSIDPTDGSLFYHTRAVNPRWARYGQNSQIIGAHIFYRDVPDRVFRGSRTRARGTVTQVSHRARATQRARGPRAGRVNGVIQYAPPNWNEVHGGDATPAPTLRVGGQPVTVAPAGAASALPTAGSQSAF
jgi:hypothetical protein